MNVVLAQVYPSRIAAIEALIAAVDAPGGTNLRAHAKQIGTAANIFGKAAAADDWRAFSAALEIVAFLVDWHQAAHDAAIDADRFLRAARLRYKSFAGDTNLSDYGKALATKLAPIESEFEPNAMPQLRAAIASVEMPVAIFGIEANSHVHRHTASEDVTKPDEVAVAFLEFTINGRSAETLHRLSAGQIHDLDLTIRVSRWPEAAEKLVIVPMSIEPASVWDFPTFEFTRPDGSPPYVFRRQGRMALHASQGFNARPLEFRYAVEFQPRIKREEHVVVAGQRTLRLDGTNTSQHALTGYGELDTKIIALRESLRLEPLISETDVRDLLTLLTPIGNLMGQAVQDKRYPEPIDEAAFQKDVQSFLRANPAIGAELEVQSQVAGGKADLSFRGIRIELKSEQTKRLLPEDCRQFAEQAASYAIGTGRRVALLCVLDSSFKTQMSFPVADGLTIIPVQTGASPVYVVSCLFQGGLARPSDLSR